MQLGRWERKQLGQCISTSCLEKRFKRENHEYKQMGTREAAEGHDSEQSKGLLEESDKDTAKPQNFKGQAEITPGFVVSFTGPVLCCA